MFALALATLLAFGQDRGARSDDVGYTGEETKYVPPPKDRLWYSNATYARVNPLGLVDIYRVGWRRRLSTKDSVLFQNTYAFIGPNVTATPAWTRVGLYGEAQILAIFRVFGEIDGVGYFGTFDQILGFDANDRFSDDAISARGDEARATTGLVANAGATLRAAVGPMAVRSTMQFVHMNLDLQNGTHFYDQLSDRLVRDGGWFYINDADLLYVNGKLRFGARHTITDGLDGGSTEGEVAQHRLGPLFAWQFKNHEPGRAFNQPTFFMVAQWWLQHPYRTGNEQPQGLPLIALGFSFNGDYWTSR